MFDDERSSPLASEFQHRPLRIAHLSLTLKLSRIPIIESYDDAGKSASHLVGLPTGGQEGALDHKSMAHDRPRAGRDGHGRVPGRLVCCRHALIGKGSWEETMAIAIPLGGIVLLFVGIRIWSFVVERNGEPNVGDVIRRHRSRSDNSDGGGWCGHHAIGCDGHDAGDGGDGGGGD
ncbi:hypothetical protein FF100_34400 [Methylobacterium terricola]|uniref:Uncharacterized protein n=1 Tax=Methylobacterium terricola TaxID=2583531 RepID=A0A5C4L5Y0_9HYPH|nr:hypothetical protein [Methylobacterium terricola]TNC06541.1 hypothetical protein FF100_34400 [Methylobacterium terricola]